MEQNNSKKILLSVLGIAILLVAVVGITFAALGYERIGNNNTITTGTVTMSFSEISNGIYLANALPMTDADGMAMTSGGSVGQRYFDFSVSTSASAAVKVTYEINVTPSNTGVTYALANNEVKIYLESSADGTTYTKVATDKDAQGNPVLVSALDATALGRADALKLKTVTDDYHTSATGGSTTTFYRLRIWVDSTVSVDKLNAVTEGYQYKLLVNVDGYAKPLGEA